MTGAARRRRVGRGATAAAGPEPASASSSGAEDWRPVQRTYLTLTLLTTLSASFIWGVNTLFLLDAGLTNTQAFSANAAYTAGIVLAEIPTGVVADTTGRRRSFLLGAASLLIATLAYLGMWQIRGPFWAWVLVSILIGVGFAFFSGAVEAWLVDALQATGFTGTLESVFARGQIVGGGAMLIGSVAGGVVAQVTNLGVPYLMRAGMLALTLGVAAWAMRDLGFTPAKAGSPLAEIRNVVTASVDAGLRNRPVRWLMLEIPFSTGVGIFVFYALQPYLLELYGDSGAFGIAGLAAAVFAGAQIMGGLAVPLVRKVVKRRTTALLLGSLTSAVVLLLLGRTERFLTAVVLLVSWSLVVASVAPIRRVYLNGLIPSAQRATVLSFDSLMGSAGAVVTQPALGRVADVQGYGASYLVSGVVSLLGLPFLLLARRERAASDEIRPEDPLPGVEPPAVPPEANCLPGQPPGGTDGP